MPSGRRRGESGDQRGDVALRARHRLADGDEAVNVALRLQVDDIDPVLDQMRGVRSRDALAAVLMGADERDAAAPRQPPVARALCGGKLKESSGRIHAEVG